MDDRGKVNVPVQSLIDHIKTAIDVDLWAKEMVESLLKEQPEIVRCRDCKYFHELEPSEFCKRMFHDETSYECWNPRLTDQDNVPTKGPDWFCADGCADGERSDGDE